MPCIICGKGFNDGDVTHVTRKGTYGSRSYRRTGIEVHHGCLIKGQWERENPDLKLDENLYDHLRYVYSYKGNHWTLDTYKLTKMTQEELDKKQNLLYTKLAKKKLLS